MPTAIGSLVVRLGDVGQLVGSSGPPNPDVPDQDGADCGSVRFPQLTAVDTVPCGEEQRATQQTCPRCAGQWTVVRYQPTRRPAPCGHRTPGKTTARHPGLADTLLLAFYIASASLTSMSMSLTSTLSLSSSLECAMPSTRYRTRRRASTSLRSRVNGGRFSSSPLRQVPTNQTVCHGCGALSHRGC